MATRDEDDSAEIAKLAAKIKLPKTAGGVADMMFKARQERYRLQKLVKEQKAIETACANKLFEDLPAREETGVKGKLAGATIVEDIGVYVSDWDKFWRYVQKRQKDGLAFFQRRANVETVKAIWAEKKKVPGVEPMKIKKISLTKI